MIRNSNDQYGLVTIAFHWLIVLFVLFSYLIIYVHGFVPKADTEGRSFLLQLHQSLGITIFVVTILRILWTLYSPRPRSFIESPAQLLLHRIVIVALYGAILVQPISGYIASKLAPDFFFVLELPLFNDYADLAQQSLKTLRKTMAFVHVNLGFPVIPGLIALHLGGALYHHFIRRDPTLRRMLTIRHGRMVDTD